MSAKNGNEQIKPEISPLKLNNLLPTNPQAKAPDNTDKIKYKLIDFDISGDLDKIYEKKTDKRSEIIIPIKQDITIPSKHLTGMLNSICFFVLFLFIKNPSHSIKNMRENIFL